MEHRGDARGRERLCDDGILAKYSRRKRIDEPGSPVRKGGVVHLRQERKDQGYAQTGLDWEEDPRNQEVLVEVGE